MLLRYAFFMPRVFEFTKRLSSLILPLILLMLVVLYLRTLEVMVGAGGDSSDDPEISGEFIRAALGLVFGSIC